MLVTDKPTRIYEEITSNYNMKYTDSREAYERFAKDVREQLYTEPSSLVLYFVDIGVFQGTLEPYADPLKLDGIDFRFIDKRTFEVIRAKLRKVVLGKQRFFFTNFIPTKEEILEMDSNPRKII